MSNDIGANASPEMVGKIGRLSREDYERFGRRTNYTPPSSGQRPRSRSSQERRIVNIKTKQLS